MRGVHDLVTVGAGRSVEETLRALKDDPAVEYAEPNWIYTTEVVSNDPYYLTEGRLWGMYSNDTPAAVGPTGTTSTFGSQAEEAWAAGHTGSSTVYIGVIDEGIDLNHPDLAPNVWTNPSTPSAIRTVTSTRTMIATATSTTRTDGTSSTATTRSTTAPRTTMGRMWPAPSRPSAAMGRVSRERLGRSAHLGQVARRGQRHHRQRDQGDRLFHRPQVTPRVEYRRLE